MSTEDIITVRPQSKNHSKFLSLTGFCLVCICLLLNSFLWDQYKYQLMLLLFASFIVLLTGVLKLTEPETSYQLTRENFVFFHRNGKWQINWHEIVRIGQTTSITHGYRVYLPYIGIKLADLQHIADSISPRLANKLIHEQKELLILSAVNRDIELTEGLISFEPYTLNGKVYKGPVAAWLYRTEQLVGLYGYHLYLPESSFDRNLSDFLTLLKSCQSHANIHQ